MALRKSKQGSAPPPPKKKPLGSVRRNQLITTYGIGSMVAVGEQSYIISGLDGWNTDDAPELREFRLQRRLGVERFRLPPYADPPAGDGVRVRRFPDMYSCPGRTTANPDGCQENLRRFGDFNSPPDKTECAACSGQLTPSRFVVVCEDGHLGDFPYWHWVHVGRPGGGHDTQHRLSFSTTGRTAALRSIEIRCSCGKYSSMEGAFSAGALKRIKYTCGGGRPWLGQGAREQGCDKPPRVLQRGSSAAWFAVMRSALSIPPFSRQLYTDIHPHLTMWHGEPDDVIARLAAKTFGDRYTAEEVVRAVRDYESYLAGERPDPSTTTGFEAADDLRVEEFKQLSHEADTHEFTCVAARPDPDHPLPRALATPMLVKRLREVRVLQAFTRLHPPTNLADTARHAPLSLTATTWLPGIEVIGEGVFLRLDEDRLREWEISPASAPARHRAAMIRAHHEALLASRTGTTGPVAPASPVTARFVLVHTLAHTMINEWSLNAGYPAAALRERLYVSDDMAGVLIYTATSDSAGSLGGVVAEGEPRHLAAALRTAMERISWCSSDPLCMETEASGADSLNRAACHACILIPETSCEVNNSFLDRALLIGLPDGSLQPFLEI
ncbi:DUF1998 domain-containing protein [Actinoplanes sp. NPDC048967]|uniref:DUF1998 domain-containing protein n=1 Tax=Actinoplanes sp. NPDC048967 TaxID=3155269 RepID=UPI0034023FFD